MTAEDIAAALGGRRAGGGWVARCPAHEDHNPSLTIRHGDDGKVLVCCRAGCKQADVIGALRSHGLWVGSGSRQFTGPAQPFAAGRRPDRDAASRTEAALAIWNSTLPATDTLVETFLGSRGLHAPPPPTLRFHPSLKHPGSGVWPAMVALITRGADGAPLAIHRTFLARDGSGKAPAQPTRMMLGPARGGAVRLGAPGDVLMIGEGVESSLAAMKAAGKPAWAALSTSGLRALDLPTGIRDVIVLADGDDPGEAAARDCAHRWRREGRRVRIARPPRGKDFNDLLWAGAS